MPVQTSGSVRMQSKEMSFVPPDFVDRVLRGEERTFSYPDTGQYVRGGLSSCGLAAMNCARVILGKARDGVKEEELLKQIASRSTMEVVRF